MSEPPFQLPQVQGEVGSPTWVLGILVAAILALASVVAFLFRLYHRRTLSHEKQRREQEQLHTQEREKWIEKEAAWDAEREAERATERANYQEMHREVVERYEKLARDDREAHYKREEQASAEHAAQLERIAQAEAKRSHSEMELLEKLGNRITGRRRGEPR